MFILSVEFQQLILGYSVYFCIFPRVNCSLPRDNSPSLRGNFPDSPLPQYIFTRQLKMPYRVKERPARIAREAFIEILLMYNML